MRFDRDEVLARTDLRHLCDELLGPPKGRGPSAGWPCPAPEHGEQTGRTPPVTVFRSREGIERWHCHGCGAGGTAIDLLMATQRLTIPEALESLARQAGVERSAAVAQFSPKRREDPQPLPSPLPNAVIEQYVTACERYLWSPEGERMRGWLTRRGLGKDIVMANRVGADPGPFYMNRAMGLPRRGPAVIFPVLEGGQAVYLQARCIQAGARRYDNPSNRLVGASPRIAEVHLAGEPKDNGIVVVCEGLPDGLTAAQAGYRAVAVLGAGLPDERLAATIAKRFPWEQLVVAFDADARGRSGAERLIQGLEKVGHGDRAVSLMVAEKHGDLNAWRQAAGKDFDERFGQAVHSAIEREAGREPGSPSLSPHRLEDLLEVIYCKYVLVDDRAEAARNVAQVGQFIDRMKHEQTLEAPAPGNNLAELLDVLTYQHLLVDDPDVRSENAGRVLTEVRRWTGEVELGLAHNGDSLEPYDYARDWSPVVDAVPAVPFRPSPPEPAEEPEIEL